MSDLLIRGMEMPKTGRYYVAVDNTDGKDKTVISVMSEFERGGKTRPLLAVHEAVPVPPHGRLIEAAALWVEIHKICDRRDAGIISDLTCLQQLLSAVRHAPTIIPAEPCNNLSKPCKEEAQP